MLATIILAALLVPLDLPEPADPGELATVAERSGYRATATHAEVVALGEKLAARSSRVALAELGKTVEGRSIPLWIVADPPLRTPEEAGASGKIVVMLLGDIHAGEVCGKEALPILVRELATAEDRPALLDDLVLLVAPIYNADGNERMAPGNRPGQVGPEQGMGVRENAQGLDLNRDFMKLDAPESRALVAALDAWDPHLFIDTHTTNGSHHRYLITYQGPKHPAGDPRVIDYVRERMLPEVGRRFHRATDRESFFYGNFGDDHTRWTTFPAQPRFGTTYVGLRNRLSILSEAYAYAPYKDRILGTVAFVKACLEYAAENREAIDGLLGQVRRDATAPPRSGQRVAITGRPVRFAEPATVLGYVERRDAGRWVATEEPRDYSVDLVNDFVPAVAVPRAFAYAIPADCPAAIESLERHGVAFETLDAPRGAEVEVARIDKLMRLPRKYEGHRPVELDLTTRTESRSLPAGTVVVATSQPLGALAACLLEAESDDGVAAWDLLGESLAVGRDYPILRLTGPLAQDRPATAVRKKPITFEVLRGSRPTRGSGGGGTFAGPTRWLDGEHLIQNRGGRLMKVEARTGMAEPLHDPAPMVKALDELPGVDEAVAEGLARRVGYDPKKSGAVVEHEDDLYFVAYDGKAAARLTAEPGVEELAEASPDGRFVAFVRDNDLYVVDAAGGPERRLTTGGSDLLRHGKADWVYFEEIFGRNWKGFWWSPDSKSIAFLEFDDRQVPTHSVLVDGGPARVVETTPYPRSGDSNPLVRLGVVKAAGGEPAYADLSAYTPDSSLISQVGWWPDGQTAYAYVQDRAQTWLDFVNVSAADGSTKKLFRETTGAWVESLGTPSFLKEGSFLVLSERDGWKHLYKYQKDGTLAGRLTSGEWEIRGVQLVDEPGGWVYFTATKDDPLGANLYRVPLAGGAVERLTREPGAHQASVSPDGKLFVDSWSSVADPPRSAVATTEGTPVRMIDAGAPGPFDAYEPCSRTLVKIPTSDGGELDGELILPVGHDPSKKYPVWMMTYAGPHTPTVTNSYAGGRARDQALANEGFIILRVDPRSASGKGAVSAWKAYRHLGVEELKDLEAAADWLKARPDVDPDRIGLAGHSYGGYITAYALTHSKAFAAGIAGAPVTDWRDYDSIYTERFMGLPQDNPEGYKASSVVEAAGDLHGKLLILHGAIDDNVSLRNTMRLVAALQRANKDFELMIYPGSRHGIGGEHYEKIQLDFIRRTLGTPKAPAPTAE